MQSQQSRDQIGVMRSVLLMCVTSRFTRLVVGHRYVRSLSTRPVQSLIFVLIMSVTVSTQHRVCYRRHLVRSLRSSHVLNASDGDDEKDH